MRYHILAASLLAFVGQSQAAVPAVFTDAVTAATTDAGLMAVALIAIAAVLVAPAIAMKFVKRIKGAA